MIENTLGSLMALMGFVWTATQLVKGFLPRVSQNLLALLIAEGATLTFWQANVIRLDGADPATSWGWGVAAFYALFAAAMAAKAHDAGQTPEIMFKRIKNGKVVP